MGRVVIVDDVRRSRSSRLMRVVSFAEGVGLHDLVMNLLLLIFEAGRLVDKPVVVSFELLKKLWKQYPAISPIHHLV
jgi:hypothetical protein